MERTFVDVGNRVGTSSAGSRGDGVGTIGAELAKSREALQGAINQTACAIRNGIKDRADGVLAYARTEPVSALSAAAGIGMLVGLGVAIASRGVSGRRGDWLSLSVLGRRAVPGWRRFLRLG